MYVHTCSRLGGKKSVITAYSTGQCLVVWCVQMRRCVIWCICIPKNNSFCSLHSMMESSWEFYPIYLLTKLLFARFNTKVCRNKNRCKFLMYNLSYEPICNRPHPYAPNNMNFQILVNI